MCIVFTADFYSGSYYNVLWVLILNKCYRYTDHNTSMNPWFVLHILYYFITYLLLQEFRVLLTGTPLQNNVEELFSLLNFLEPSKFPILSTFMEKFGDLKTEEQVEQLKEVKINFR